MRRPSVREEESRNARRGYAEDRLALATVVVTEGLIEERLASAARAL